MSCPWSAPPCRARRRASRQGRRRGSRLINGPARLRTLSAIAECLDLIEQTTEHGPTSTPCRSTTSVSTTICKSTPSGFPDRVAAQQQSLWQSQPRCFNDLIVQVAIIRPGPIQGDAVHPYLRRRQGLEPVTYLHPTLEPILQNVWVVLYRSRSCASSWRSPSNGREADRFRRHERHRSRLEMEELRDGFIRRCIEHDLSEESRSRSSRASRALRSSASASHMPPPSRAPRTRRRGCA